MHRLPTGLLAVLLAAPMAGAQGDIADFRFEVETLGGGKITQEDFKGHPAVIVDLWGTWCGPCVKAVPVLQGLYAKYKHYGLEIVGLNYEMARGDHAAIVRSFAAKHGVTYPLAIGKPSIKAQVPGFRGYPTMLFFEKGMVHSHTEVGFDPSKKGKLEGWIRKALGLEEGDGPSPFETGRPRPVDPPADEPEEAPEEEEIPEEEPEELAPGVIFKPGDGDTGFDFEVTDLAGEELKFADLRGKPVLLALTSTWDGTAVDTAKLLDEMYEAYAAKGVVVLGASLEMAAQRAGKVKAIESFRAKHGCKFRVFPAGLAFQRKIHLFSGMPLFLVFDGEGTLVLREGDVSDKTRDAIKTTLDNLVQ